MRNTLLTLLFLIPLFYNFYSQEKEKDSLNFQLISLEEINVTSTRAIKEQPFSFSNIDKSNLEPRNLGQDLPILLNFLPSVVTTSDAGAGIGYTGIRVRGSDATRVNVTINGIPYNDSESQGTFWVNLPDFSSSVENIQLQRGVGTSTNGASAFGASLNILTDGISNEKFLEISNSFGSFSTLKNTVKFSTGGINDNFQISGRFSKIVSDGYIERASSDLHSYFLQTSFSKKRTLIKALIFGGHEKTYQAYWGIDAEMLSKNRRYNSAGEIYGESGNLENFYYNQVDNYKQDHLQIHWNQILNDKLSSSIGVNYTYGRGYYEEYNDKWKDENFSFSGMTSFSNLGLDNLVFDSDIISSSDNVTRKWLDNDYYVITGNLQYNSRNLKMAFGFLASNYDGDHFGKLRWSRFSSQVSPNHEFYRNRAEKNEFSIYGKFTRKISQKITGFLDLQIRKLNYKVDGFLNGLVPINISDNFAFFNPKAGMTYRLKDNADLYFSFAKSHREPNRTDYENGNPIPEKLNNFELGLRKSNWSMNIYYMRYKDQLVLTGEIDEVGSPIRQNIGDSYRLGLEFDSNFKISSKLSWTPNLSLSENKNIDFYFKRDGVLKNIGNTNISFSPSIVAASAIQYKLNEKTLISVLTKYVGEQYMGNIDSKISKLNSYSTTDLNLIYQPVNFLFFKDIKFTILFNNVFGLKYISNGYFYTFDDDYSTPGNIKTIEGVGYYPQADRNFLVGINTRF
ncbi:MAG: TonB-dependent receptor [Flavobacteriaceae bacterium TMED206]|nr:MAG: TonB-dependent receptor [Flavobacteriaceae bacterium TMED206]